MSGQADVKSIDTLAFVKAALVAFAHETGQAISEVELEGRRGIDWITVDQAAYWKAEIRRAAELVNKAIKDLEHCRTYKKVGDNQPSCIEEKKALEKARARLARAEQKAEAVRRWTPIVLQQFRETCVRLVHFQEVVDVDAPRAVARVEQMLRSLEAYRSVSSPRPSGGDGTAGQPPSVAREVEARAGGGQPSADVAQPEAVPLAAAGDPPAGPVAGGAA